jgi:hypothetical protein
MIQQNFTPRYLPEKNNKRISQKNLKRTCVWIFTAAFHSSVTEVPK